MCHVYKGGEEICKRKQKRNMALKKMTSIKFSLWLRFGVGELGGGVKKEGEKSRHTFDFSLIASV